MPISLSFRLSDGLIRRSIRIWVGSPGPGRGRCTEGEIGYHIVSACPRYEESVGNSCGQDASTPPIAGKPARLRTSRNCRQWRDSLGTYTSLFFLKLITSYESQ